MLALAVGLAFPVGMSAVGALYALRFDPKATLPKWNRRRLK